MTDTVPFDADAIRRYGVERWCADYPLPVHWRDFSGFVDTLFAGLDTIFTSVERADQETLIGGSDFVIALRDLLYAEAAELWAIEHGRSLDMSAATRKAITPDVTALENPFTNVLGGRFELALRSLARGWIENRPLGVAAQIKAQLATLAGAGDNWSVGTVGGLKRSGIASLGEPVRTVYADALIAQALQTSTPARSPRLDAAVDTFGQELERVVATTLGRGLDAPRFATLELIRAWKARLAMTRGLIDALRTTIRHPPRQLHLNEVWRTNHRVLSIALRAMGTEIVAYGHGNDPMHVLQPQHAFMAYGHIGTCVCETPASAVAHGAHYRNSPVARVFPVTFRSAGTEKYAQDFSVAAAPAPTTSRVRVMLMGYPVLAQRTQFDVTNGLAMHLEAERRLLRRLRDKGFYTIYKAHPETRAAAVGLFDDAADEVSFEPFERVLDRTDVILFLTTVSSTFGTAVCSRKPIVVLDHAGKAWHPLLKDLYAQRCRLVPSWLSDDNRISFDEATLLRALAVPGPAPDFAVVERVFSPTPWNGPTDIEPAGKALAVTTAVSGLR